jgi:hypothetical protein
MMESATDSFGGSNNANDLYDDAEREFVPQTTRLAGKSSGKPFIGPVQPALAHSSRGFEVTCGTLIRSNSFAAAGMNLILAFVQAAAPKGRGGHTTVDLPFCPGGLNRLPTSGSRRHPPNGLYECPAFCPRLERVKGLSWRIVQAAAAFAATVVREMIATELGTISGTGDEVTGRVSAGLECAGLRVRRSFDLRSARAPGGEHVCPRHGRQGCDCQMIVLLVYQGQRAPATLMLLTHLGRTWIMLAETPDGKLQAAIAEALAPIYTVPAETS